MCATVLRSCYTIRGCAQKRLSRKERIVRKDFVPFAIFAPVVNSLNHDYSFSDREDAVEKARASVTATATG